MKKLIFSVITLIVASVLFIGCSTKSLEKKNLEAYNDIFYKLESEKNIYINLENSSLKIYSDNGFLVLEELSIYSNVGDKYYFDSNGKLAFIQNLLNERIVINHYNKNHAHQLLSIFYK